MLEKGLKNTFEMKVTAERCANAIGSGGLEVFATPVMITGMEGTCLYCVQPYLEEGMTTVGTAVNIVHTAATPLGDTATFACELTEIDGRRLVFDVKAFDSNGLIGEGTHERFIVHGEKFVEKCRSKLAK